MKRILIVDDDIELSGLIKAVLVQAGYAVLVSNESRQGISVAKEKKPDLILMDVMLPDLSGADVVDLLKSDPSSRDIPIIFLTGLLSGNDDYETEETIKVRGLNYMAIAKPFDMKYLLTKVREVIG